MAQAQDCGYWHDRAKMLIEQRKYLLEKLVFAGDVPKFCWAGLLAEKFPQDETLKGEN